MHPRRLAVPRWCVLLSCAFFLLYLQTEEQLRAKEIELARREQLLEYKERKVEEVKVNLEKGTLEVIADKKNFFFKNKKHKKKQANPRQISQSAGRCGTTTLTRRSPRRAATWSSACTPRGSSRSCATA